MHVQLKGLSALFEKGGSREVVMEIMYLVPLEYILYKLHQKKLCGLDCRLFSIALIIPKGRCAYRKDYKILKFHIRIIKLVVRICSEFEERK